MSKYILALITLISMLLLPLVAMPEITQTKFKGKLLYIKKNEIWSYDQKSNEHKQITKKHNVTNYTISNDGEILVYVSSNKLYLLNLSTNKDEFLANAETDMSSPTLSSSNDTIIYVSKSEREFQKSKYLKKKARHLWAIDIRSRKKKDITKESPYEYTMANYSPDGKYISFSSNQGNGWNVFVMTKDYSQITKIGDGMHSEWLQKDTLAIGNFDKVTIYNVNDKTKVREIKIIAMFNPAKFSFNNVENVYYEEMTENPDIDLSYIDVANGKTDKIATDARAPKFVR